MNNDHILKISFIQITQHVLLSNVWNYHNFSISIEILIFDGIVFHVSPFQMNIFFSLMHWCPGWIHFHLIFTLFHWLAVQSFGDLVIIPCLKTYWAIHFHFVIRKCGPHAFDLNLKMDFLVWVRQFDLSPIQQIAQWRMAQWRAKTKKHTKQKNEYWWYIETERNDVVNKTVNCVPSAYVNRGCARIIVFNNSITVKRLTVNSIRKSDENWMSAQHRTQISAIQDNIEIKIFQLPHNLCTKLMYCGFEIHSVFLYSMALHEQAHTHTQTYKLTNVTTDLHDRFN